MCFRWQLRGGGWLGYSSLLRTQPGPLPASAHGVPGQAPPVTGPWGSRLGSTEAQLSLCQGSPGWGCLQLAGGQAASLGPSPQGPRDFFWGMVRLLRILLLFCLPLHLNTHVAGHLPTLVCRPGPTSPSPETQRRPRVITLLSCSALSLLCSETGPSAERPSLGFSERKGLFEKQQPVKKSFV